MLKFNYYAYKIKNYFLIKLKKKKSHKDATFIY